MMDKIPNWWHEAPVTIQVMATIGVVITIPIWIVPVLLALFIYGMWETIDMMMS